MLKSLDVLIGLTVVLLALSMAVTVITQSLTTILNSRGRHLRRGLADLLKQIDPKLADTSKSIATKVLTDPLVSGTSLLGQARLGNVIHREEFTKLLMGFAAAGDENDAKNLLKTALKNNGVSDPEQTLKNVRALATQLEKTAPELSNTVRQNMALLHEAESDFVAKINNWFDQTMDRTSQRFTASTRAITFAGAFVVAFGLQVDTPTLVNRLAADDKLRDALVQQAITQDQKAKDAAAEKARAEAAAQQPPANPPAQTPPASAPAQTTAQAVGTDAARTAAIDQEYKAFLAENGLIKLPSGGLQAWKNGFTMTAMLGMLITALLLSLGAPFWYSMLGKLLQLRSVLAVKDDVQRAERQSAENTVAAGTSAAAASAAAAIVGERGELQAIG